jgi:hypothetical protein
MSTLSQVIAHSSNLRWVISTLESPKPRITGPSVNHDHRSMSHMIQAPTSVRPINRLKRGRWAAARALALWCQTGSYPSMPSTTDQPPYG